jgi:type IV conjugative transfer system coupling protein TraD
MLENFTRGGQIFLHNLAMLKQVLAKTFLASVCIAILVSGFLSLERFKAVDFYAATSYMKATATLWFHDNRLILHKNARNSKALVDAHDKHGLFAKNVRAEYVMNHPKFKTAYQLFMNASGYALIVFGVATASISAVIFLIWMKFGKNASDSKLLSGDRVLSGVEVTRYLRNNNKASSINIDGMALIKDQETRHILVTGMTGSGKTNLINKILPQVRKHNQSALVVDQTGEMLSRYYDPERGDIIFNPLDERSKIWNFFEDCTSPIMNESGINHRLEKFSKVLFGFNKKNNHSDPFWENSAATVFCAAVQKLIDDGNRSVEELKYMIGKMDLETLKLKLFNSNASRYLTGDNKTTASSILSVLATSSKPLNYLVDAKLERGKETEMFSLKNYFLGHDGRRERGSWLFLTTPPNLRELISPLLACMVELSCSFLIESGIDNVGNKRMWFVLDELAALGRLNSLTTLMTESRKYGGCVLAALQSYNQLLDNYGTHLGSTLFGQFATKFLFRCNEPNMAKLMSDMFGNIEYMQQQKNTSYGAHEHRDGISYTEHERRKPLIESSQFMELSDLECFVSLPDPKIKVAKLRLEPVKNLPIKHDGYIEKSSIPASQHSVEQKKELNLNKLELSCSRTQIREIRRDLESLNEDQKIETAEVEIELTH